MQLKLIYGKRDRKADRHVIELAYPSDNKSTRICYLNCNKQINMNQATVNVNTS